MFEIIKPCLNCNSFVLKPKTDLKLNLEDIIETIEASGPSSVLGFTIWYAKKGFGTIQTLPAFEDKEIRKIIKKG